MSSVDEALAAAAPIRGWMADLELRWLAERAAEYRAIIEVGSYCGRSTKVLSMMTEGVVFSVDNLRGEADVAHLKGKALDAEFRQNLAPEIKAGKLKIIRTPSPQAAQRFKRGSYDMVFIDGNHSMTAVTKDIRAWRHRLASGGLICGHDAPDPNVNRALGRLGINGRGPDRIWCSP